MHLQAESPFKKQRLNDPGTTFLPLAHNLNQSMGLSKELLLNSFSFLESRQIGIFATISHTWRDLTKVILRDRKISLMARSDIFGPSKWNFLFGENCISVEECNEAFNTLKPHINELSSPTDPTKKYLETETFTYIPKKIFEEKLGVINYGLLLQKKFPETDDGYGLLWSGAAGLDEEKEARRSGVYENLDRMGVKYIEWNQITTTVHEYGWMSMSKKLVSNVTSRAEHFRILKTLNPDPKKEIYKVPSTLPAIISVSTEYLNNGTIMFKGSFTYCQERMIDQEVVVRMTKKGVEVLGSNEVNQNMFEYHPVGIAPLREF